MNVASPTVSVIVATFNRATRLPACLKSILGQTYGDYEIIVVDDASTDDTAEVVRSFREPRIQYRRCAENRGPGAARNIGIAMARGKYIGFLDSDDRYRPQTIERQLEAIAGFDLLVCASQTGGRKRVRGRFAKTTVDLPDLRKGYWFGGGASSLMGRATVLRAIRFDESLRRDEDWDLLLRAALRYRIGYLDEPLVMYDDGTHDRITNTLINAPIGQLERGMGVLRKHKELLGPFWFNYHVAVHLLSYLKHRRPLLGHLTYVIRRCGLRPVSVVVWHKFFDRLSLPWRRIHEHAEGVQGETDGTFGSWLRH